ncbi:MAG: hypothetical protein LJE70_12325 [Chromatiaceae bacterium]|jgi:hypothetical protein|nr:hypothetical protein [Chromatiaceae bacterium]
MQWLIPVATAVWAVWTWAHDHEKERQRERVRMAALYVNPFLSACEDLQSRIYKLLELGGLDSLRRRYPDGSFAEETLYLVVRFFGWSAAVNRYGPYTQDPQVIGLVTSIRKAFSTCSSQCPVGPFNFFIPEQKALGKMVMHSVEGEYGKELDTISFYEFKNLLGSTPLSDSEAVKETLKILRSALEVEEIEGRERLADAQNHLVDLLSYLEASEGYSLFAGVRRKCRTRATGRRLADERSGPSVAVEAAAIRA